jgi:hypothetical protein
MSYLLAYNPYNTNLFMRTRSIDPAAQDFIDAAGITGDVQQQAINNLVKGLKADGLWSKMKAVYPFVTDNRNLFGYTENLPNPAWQKLYVTVTDNQLAPNNTNTAFKVQNDASAPYCLVRQTGLISSPTAVLSFYVKKIDYDFIYIRGNAIPWYYVNLNTLATSNPNISISAIENNWFRVSLKNDVNIGWGQFGVGVAETDAAALGKSAIFWHPQLELGSTLTEYQPIATTQQAFIAAQFKYNLVNPVDSDAAFRLVFNGGWTHSSNGATPNGTNAYADTKLNPSVVINNINDGHLSYYSRSNTSGISAVEMGCANEITAFDMFIKFGSNLAGACINMLDSNTFTNNNDTTGFYHANQNNTANIRKMFRNGNSIATQNVFQNSTPSLNIFIGARNSISSAFYTNRQCAFSSIGNGLTDTEAANLYTRVQAFQTALSRNV